MSSDRQLSPQDRLAVSRQAILSYMTTGDDAPGVQRAEANTDKAADAGASGRGRGAWQIIKRAARVWWHHHPAQLALDVARPVLGKYAREKPYQLLAVAAIAGAVVVVARPWRLVSLTGLALATLKSSHASELLLSLLSTHPEPPTNENHN